jgi:transposase
MSEVLPPTSVVQSQTADPALALLAQPEAPALVVVVPESTPAEPARPAAPAPRLRPINRDLCSTSALDELLPSDHLVRLVWAYVQELDLSDFYATIRAVAGVPGRDTTDPALLVALWLYATIDGVTSARRLDELCRHHLVYQWLRGGVSLNPHTLSDFRVGHHDRLNELFTDTIACFQVEGLVDLDRTAQDGLKIRAAAGECSLRREGSLHEALAKAQEYLRQLEEQEDQGASKRQRAAQQRGVRDRVKRLKEALVEMEKVKKQREEHARHDAKDTKPKEPRVSTTDPEAHKMKMADGGYRLAYNGQLNTEVGAGIIVGVAVSTAGNDTNEMLPMLAQMEKRHEKVPDDHLVDGGYVNKEQFEQAKTAYEVEVYAPLKEEKKQLEEGKDPYKPKRGDGPAVAEWRARMGTAEAKEIYKQRASTAEWANAQARNRGLYQVRVRGQQKVLTVLLWYALAHNLVRALALRAAKANAPKAEAGGAEAAQTS